MGHVEIPLSGRLGAGKVTLIDEADLPLVTASRWHLNNGYARTKRDNRMLLMHRLLLDPPDGMYVDHINGDRLDNRRANLRLVTPAQNMWNRRPNTGRRAKGARWRERRGKWESEIKVGNRTVYLGMFPTREQALAAYDEASRRFHGEYGRPNAKETP